MGNVRGYSSDSEDSMSWLEIQKVKLAAKRRERVRNGVEQGNGQWKQRDMKIFQNEVNIVMLIHHH